MLLPLRLFLSFVPQSLLALVWASYTWSVPNPKDWQVGTDQSLQLLVGREPPTTLPRRPFQFALADAGPFRKVEMELDAFPKQRSLMLVFAYQDSAHFDYAHFSTDPGTKVAVHNGIFHVFGGERVRISDPSGPASFALSQRWYHVVLTWDGSTGSVHTTVDGVAVPALQAVDVSLKQGRVGIGSFDETADFRNLKIRGQSPSTR